MVKPEENLIRIARLVSTIKNVRIKHFNVTEDQIRSFYDNLVARGLDTSVIPCGVPAFRRKDYLVEAVREGQFYIVGIKVNLIGEKP